MDLLETTNDAFYNYDTLAMDYKTEVISDFWDKTYGNDAEKTA